MGQTLLEDIWPWQENMWPALGPVGAEECRQMILDMRRQMTELGPDAIQQFDQGRGRLKGRRP